MANISFNPWATTFSNGLFQVQSGGLRQGTTYPEPGLRYQRRTGVLASDETLPMWGGVGIYEYIPGVAGGPNANLGPVIGRATSISGGSKNLVGFSVFDGAYGMVITPQNNVPLVSSGGQVQSYRLGSGMRLAVQCDDTLASLEGSSIDSAVAWDFDNQRLIPYEASAFTINATGSSYTSLTGVVELKFTAPVNFGVGDALLVAGATGTGADLALVDGVHTVTAVGTDTAQFVIATGKTITSITGGTATLGGVAAAALPVKVLEFQIGNSMTVEWDSVNSIASYNFSGNAAIIQL